MGAHDQQKQGQLATLRDVMLNWTQDRRSDEAAFVDCSLENLA
jgi:hypothetical protein